MGIKYIVEARKWFDKVNGNTYHCVNITDAKKNKVIFSSGFSYGYGDAYRQTALDGLIKLGLFKKEDRSNHELIRNTIFFMCSEVRREKELRTEEATQ